MCKLLVAANAQKNDMLSEKARMYVHLLKLPVELQFASTEFGVRHGLSSSQHIDILMTNHCTDGLYEYASKKQPGIKRVIVSNDAQGVCQDDTLCFPDGIDIASFYHAISVFSPETTRRAVGFNSSSRWYGTNKALQERILRVLQIIKDEYADDLSLDYLAAKVYISPCYLSTLFRKFMGVSPLAYLNEYRMEMAVQKLIETNDSITDICQAVGYRNLPYFCTCFKKKYNMTPAQFRDLANEPELALA